MPLRTFHVKRSHSHQMYTPHQASRRTRATGCEHFTAQDDGASLITGMEPPAVIALIQTRIPG